MQPSGARGSRQLRRSVRGFFDDLFSNPAYQPLDLAPDRSACREPAFHARLPRSDGILVDATKTAGAARSSPTTPSYKIRRSAELLEAPDRKRSPVGERNADGTTPHPLEREDSSAPRASTPPVDPRKTNRAGALSRRHAKISEGWTGGASTLRSCHASQSRKHRFRERRIVDGHGVEPGDHHICRGAGARRDRLCGELDPAMHVGLDFGAERADGSLELHLIRDDVVPNAAVDTADRDDGGCLRDIELTARDRLESENDLRAHDNRIHAGPRCSTVRLLALHGIRSTPNGQRSPAR